MNLNLRRTACFAGLLAAFPIANATSFQFRVAAPGVVAPPTAAVTTLSAGDGAFGLVPAGQAATSRTITLGNSGSNPANLSITISGNTSEFTAALAGCGNLTKNATCSLNLGFTPSSVGARPGATVTINGASNSPTVALSGTGTVTGLALTGNTRWWADGTYATSCQQYLAGTQGHAYAGATGTGFYRINSDGAGKLADVYCDQATDGGGWAYAGGFNKTSHLYSGAVAAGQLAPPSAGHIALFGSTSTYAFSAVRFTSSDGGDSVVAALAASITMAQVSASSYVQTAVPLTSIAGAGTCGSLLKTFWLKGKSDVAAQWTDGADWMFFGFSAYTTTPNGVGDSWDTGYAAWGLGMADNTYDPMSSSAQTSGRARCSTFATGHWSSGTDTSVTQVWIR